MAVTARPVLENTLVLLVTCSMDKSRAELGEKVIRNLIEQSRRLDFLSSFIVFDNASTHDTHSALLPDDVVVVKADRNIGYWSAIYWTLRHHQGLLGRTFDYIYIIESDLMHYDMERLVDCETFLTAHAGVGAVRTQEFSVRARWRYDKHLGFLPFGKRNSRVVLINALTGKRVRFTKADSTKRIYTCEFHTKLPALNRLPAMNAVFDALSKRDRISELDFMHLYGDIYPTIAVLDGGIFRSEAYLPDRDVVTGSFTEQDVLERIGYENTRLSTIHTEGFDVHRFR